MTPQEIEGAAEYLYRRAKADPLSLPAAERLALDLLGTKVRTADARLLRGADGCFTIVNHQPTIWIRRGLTPERQRFVVCHEIAEWHLRQVNYRNEDVEQVANAIGGALVAPRAAFREALRDHGETAFQALATDFQTTQTCAALRLGEVTGRALVVVAPMSVRARGESFEWPDEDTIRRLVRSSLLPANLERIVLTDERKRTVLLAA